MRQTAYKVVYCAATAKKGDSRSPIFMNSLSF